MSIESKHLIESSETLVLDSLVGLCELNPALALDVDNKILFVKEQDRSKVALVCGGGSGHEPAHSGYVGEGMLSAAICGHVFASPNPSQVRRGIQLVENEVGTVIIVKNYTGDILNFGLAKEQYAARHPNKAEKVRFVIVGDDVAVGRIQGKIVGRRGLAGTVLVYKIAGALAQQGAGLDDVYRIAEWTANNIVTIGASLGHVHVPGTAPLQRNLQESELEIGMGIHNESGNERTSPIPSLSQLIAQLLEYLTTNTDEDRSFLSFKAGDEIVFLVNNLGGLSLLELGGIVAEARKQLSNKGLKLARVLAGTFMTSLNMPGFSLSLLLLPSAGSTSPSSSEILALLDSKPNVSGWPWTSGAAPVSPALREIKGARNEILNANVSQIKAKDPAAFVSNIRNAAEALIAAEPEITQMDLIAGDGDCGLTLKDGSQAVLEKINSGDINGESVVSSLITIAQVAEEVMGGTSGALYSIFFSALAQGFQSQDIASGATVAHRQWQTALSSALKKFYTYTRAREPSRTLVDPLAAFVEEVQRSGSFADAVIAAAKAAEATKDLEARAGRSAYVGNETLMKERVADPGAWGVKTILEHISF